MLAMGELLNNPSLDPWFKIGDQIDSDDETVFRWKQAQLGTNRDHN